VALNVADFFERIDALAEMVGHGELTGMVEVSQIYAFAQHEHLEYRHPRGGQALYLQEPLMSNYSRYLEDYARTVMEDGGEPAFIAAMEDLAEDGGVATRAPVLYSNLRASGHPSVTSDGETVYDREPRQHRLSEEELRAIYREHNPVPSRFTAKQLRFLWARGI
jgi:hypothetical protein